MSFKKQEVNNYLLYDTPIENIFISEYAKNAPGEYVKVYLLAYMYSCIGKSTDNRQLSDTLGMSVDDLKKCWEYWESVGLVRLLAKESPSDFEVEFISIKEKLLSMNGDAKASGSNARKLQSEEAEKLLHDIEHVTNRLLEAKEPEAVISWIKDLNMPADVILRAYMLCVKKGTSTRYRYVEKVILEWHERGLNDMEKLEEYLSDTDKHYDFYRKVFKILGFRRNPTQAETEVMDTWIDKLGCTVKDVEKACKKTIGISNPNISYINTILLSDRSQQTENNAAPHLEGIKTVEDIYEQIRNENAKKTEQNRSAVYRKIPRLEEIMTLLRESSFTVSKLMLAGASGAEALEKEKQEQKKLLEEKVRLLSAAGLRADILDPIYCCRQCQDTGILENGQRCSCFNDRMREYKEQNK